MREPVSVDVAEGEAVTAPILVMEPYESAPAPSPKGDASAPTGGIEGRVTTPDQRPLPGFTIRATASGGTVRGGVAGPQGWFRLMGLAEGTWSLIPMRGQGVAGPPQEVMVRAGEVVGDVALVTRPTYVLAGTVVDDAGAPVAGVSVGARPADARRHGDTPEGAGTYTDDTGCFEVLVLSDREWSFTVHGTTLSGTWPSGARDIRLVYTSRKTQPVTVVVRGSDGEAVPRAVVWVRWRSEGGGRSGTALTAGGGRFYGELPADVERVDVEVSRPCDAVGRALDWQPRTIEDLPLDGDPLEVVLVAGRSVTIRVLDPAGALLPGVLVRVFPVPVGRRWPVQDPNEWARAPLTDVTGTCVIRGLPTAVDLLVVAIFAGARPPGVNPPPQALGPRRPSRASPAPRGTRDGHRASRRRTPAGRRARAGTPGRLVPVALAGFGIPGTGVAVARLARRHERRRALPPGRCSRRSDACAVGRW